MKTGTPRFFTKGARPRQWSPCSCEMTMADMQPGSRPHSLSRRAVSRPLNPTSTSTRVSPSLTRVAFPELPLPRTVISSPILSHPQVYRLEPAPILASQERQCKRSSFENLVREPPDLLRTDTLDLAHHLLDRVEPLEIDLLLGQLRHPARGAFQTEHDRPQHVVLGAPEFVRRHNLPAHFRDLAHDEFDNPG